MRNVTAGAFKDKSRGLCLPD